MKASGPAFEPGRGQYTLFDCTLGSLISVALRLLIFGFFSRGYALIQGGYGYFIWLLTEMADPFLKMAQHKRSAQHKINPLTRLEWLIKVKLFDSGWLLVEFWPSFLYLYYIHKKSLRSLSNILLRYPKDDSRSGYLG